MAECSKSRSMATPDLLESAFQSLQNRCGDYTKVNIKHVETMHFNQVDGCPLPSNNELMKIKELLKDRYKRKDACMLSLLWDDHELDYPLDGYCVDLKVEEKDLMGTFSEGNVISLNKIFFSEDEYGRRSKRQILITGDAGYGKTTLAKKLSYDWATLDPGSYISRFDMLVNIPLIATEHQTLKESIQNALDIDEETNKTIINMELQWLIILDGLDEAPHPNLALSFLEGIQGNYPNSTIIITSRPYAVKDVKSLFDRRLCILGLSKENQKRYIKAVFSPNTDKEMAMVKEIENDAFLCKASECPLLLHMMCCVYGIEYDKGTSSITSRTTLYRQIFNLLRIRYLKKHGKTGTIEASDIVDDNLFINLGKVAQSYLRSFNLINEEVLRREFSKEEDYNVVLRLGILLGQPVRVNMRVKLKYEFLHRTFAEFLEAIFIVYLTKQSSQDLSQVLPTSDNLGTAAFVAGLMGREFVEHRPILLWISENRKTLSELAEIKNEANLDDESWELMSSLINRIEYHDSSIERNLLHSSKTLTNFRVIKIKTRIVNEDFWKCVNLIIQGSNTRAEISMELPVSVAELTSLESTVKIRFINMENMMNELIHISNLLFEKRNRFYGHVYIHPANVSRIMEGEDSRTANRTMSWNKPVGLLAKSFCPVSQCKLNSAGGTWTFGRIKIYYGKKFGVVNVKESEQETASIIPILVISEAQYSSIRKESPLDHDSLRIVDFKDISMCRTSDDLRTPQRLGRAESSDVFERLRQRQIDLYHIHDWSNDHQLVNSFEITLPSKSHRQCCIIV